MPSTPWSFARRTSSGSQIPFRISGRSVSDRSQGRSSQVSGLQLREVRGGQISGTPAGHPRVEGDHDALEAGVLSPADKARGEVAVGRSVELEEPTCTAPSPSTRLKNSPNKTLCISAAHEHSKLAP